MRSMREKRRLTGWGCDPTAPEPPIMLARFYAELVEADEWAAVLLEQGRSGELLGILDDGAVLWRLRCRAEQGYIRAAADLAASASADAANGAAYDAALRLW